MFIFSRALKRGVFSPFLFLILFLPSSVFAEQVFFFKYLEKGSGEKELISRTTKEINTNFFKKEIHELSYPQFIIEEEALPKDRIFEIYSRSKSSGESLLKTRGVNLNIQLQPDLGAENDEVITIVETGPSSNRIDLVFMGDGYTESEREKFVSDIHRLVDDLFNGQTYKSYLPLFNIYAVYRPSAVSGIGVNDTPKNTSYGLYRLGNTLRAIMISKPSAARNSCLKAPGCDYPILVANDPYYGGLGGEFAITTSSPQSGKIVLRHELGHNFGRVGEEYDGNVFFGANYASRLQEVGWTHWLSNPLRAEPAIVRVLKWPWHNLANGDYKVSFNSDVKFPNRQITISVSGNETPGSIAASIDGISLPLFSPGNKDRYFQEFHSENVTPGTHQIVFHEESKDGDNWVSSLSVHEYGADFNFDKSNIGAYPVFYAVGDLAGYRSNNESCLMRNMNHNAFCSVCQENNWLHFFYNVNLIDKLDVNYTPTKDRVTASLKTLELAQLRGKDVIEGEKLEIQWIKDKNVVPSLNNLLTWSLPIAESRGNWVVKVKFVSPEIRNDPTNLLADSKDFIVN